MKGDGIDRRRYVRINLSFTTHIHGPKFTISTYAKNISEGGLRVIIQEQLEVSSIVDLEVYLKEAPVLCKGKVAWVKGTKGDSSDKDETVFDTGIEFQEMNKAGTLLIKNIVIAANEEMSKTKKEDDTLTAKHIGKKSKERRRWWRWR